MTNNMKKTYIIPEMEIIKIGHQQHLMAGSLNPGSNSGTINEDPVPDGTPGEGRYYDFWGQD